MNSELLQRLIAKTLIKDDESCWEWLGHITKLGYGVLCYNKVRYKTHRLMWMFANDSSIPRGMLIMHTCDNRACVNPNHLKLGTQDDNMKDCANKGRIVKSLGEKSGRSKLTDVKVKEIISLLPSLTNKKIADLYNVTESNIAAIRKGKTWKHMPR